MKQAASKVDWDQLTGDIPKLLEGEQLQSMLGRGSARCWYKHSCKKYIYTCIGKLTSKSVSPKNEKNNLHFVWAYGTDPEKAMAPHSSTLTWISHGRRSLVGCSPWGR